LGIAGRYGLTPESVGVDTLYFNDPGSYMFEITGETPEGKSVKGTTRATGALPLKWDVDEAIEEHYKDSSDPFASFNAKMALKKSIDSFRDKETTEKRQADILKKMMLESDPNMTEEEYDAFIKWKKKNKYQEGGEVMNYYGGGMVRDARARYQEGGVVEALEAFGEKSKDADDLSIMAVIEMLKARKPPAVEDLLYRAKPGYTIFNEPKDPMVPPIYRAKPGHSLFDEPKRPMTPMQTVPPDTSGAWEERPTTGLQQGGPVPPMPQQGLPPAGFMQEGGDVEQPMPVGEAAGMQEMPVPEGERAYPKEPMDQLGLEEHEYAAYTEHGPDVYKYLAPKYKPKVQWSPYDAMVDAGSINPYEIDKDDFVVMTREQANALRGS